MERARRLVEDGRRAFLGIVGLPGSGKSTLAERLLAELSGTPPEGHEAGEWVAHLPMDGFHLATAELARLGLSSRRGAPDTFDAAGYVALLRRLAADTAEVVYAPSFERSRGEPLAGRIAVTPAARLIITEGNYLLVDDPAWLPLRTVLDEVWFCATDDQRRRRQLIARHVAFGKTEAAAEAWADGVDQANCAIISRTSHLADLVVSEDVMSSLLLIAADA
nr:nucleoside/nucleotide kinase family protein [Pseudonocardia oroxyli]